MNNSNDSIDTLIGNYRQQVESVIEEFKKEQDHDIRVVLFAKGGDKCCEFKCDHKITGYHIRLIPAFDESIMELFYKNSNIPEDEGHDVYIYGHTIIDQDYNYHRQPYLSAIIFDPYCSKHISSDGEYFYDIEDRDMFEDLEAIVKLMNKSNTHVCDNDVYKIFVDEYESLQKQAYEDYKSYRYDN
jgi:hypothetical protein